MAQLCVGIDVAKGTLQACATGTFGRRGRTFPNTPQGFEALSAWARGQGESPRFCLEATGWYSLGIALHLAQAGCFVAVENPRFIKHFAMGAKLQNKTDEADAFAIAEYLRRMEPPAWKPKEPERRELAGILDRHSELQAEALACENRLENPHLSLPVRESLLRTLEHLRKEEATLLKAAEAHVASVPFLASETASFALVPCVASLSAMRIAAFLGSPETFESAQSFAATAGVNPRRRESGTWQGKTTISRSGNPTLRGDLSMATLAATQKNPQVRAFYLRLLEKGKPKKAALLAAMRKLLMLCYGVYRSIQKGIEPFGIRASEEERKAKRKEYDREYRRKRKEAKLKLQKTDAALTT